VGRAGPIKRSFNLESIHGSLLNFPGFREYPGGDNAVLVVASTIKPDSSLL
jgi:hypothetical protein